MMSIHILLMIIIILPLVHCLHFASCLVGLVGCSNCHPFDNRMVVSEIAYTLQYNILLIIELFFVTPIVTIH